MEIQTEKAILMRSQVEMTNISFIGHRREGNPKDKMAKNLAELCLFSHVLWKVELLRNKIGYLVEETSKQSVESVTWLLPTTYSKIEEE